MTNDLTGSASQAAVPPGRTSAPTSTDTGGPESAERELDTTAALMLSAASTVSPPEHLAPRVLKAVARRRRRQAVIRQVGVATMVLTAFVAVAWVGATAAIAWSLQNPQVAQAAFSTAVTTATASRSLLGVLRRAAAAAPVGLALRALWLAAIVALVLLCLRAVIRRRRPSAGQGDEAIRRR